jgi:PAS domain S-box-containing protein
MFDDEESSSMAEPLRLLLLEDSPEDARLIVHELRRAGLDPLAERVETARDFIAHLDPIPDIILADYRLPGFTALEALRIVRDRAPGIPFLVVTGALGDEAAVECLREGALDYLLKDRLARLGAAVTQALHQKRLRDEQRRADLALRESEARKAAILETAVEAIITIDEGCRVESLNPAAERLFGYRAEDRIGRGIAILFPPDAAGGPAQSLLVGDPAAGGDGCTVAAEITGRRSDGSVFPAELSTSEVRFRERRIFTKFVRDISERKAAELELAQRARELARSNIELEQFAYVASHDLKEPLRHMSSFTQLLARRYADKLDATGHEFMSFIVDGAARMERLIDDLLLYSRAGTRGARLELVDCNEVIERVLANLKSSIDEVGAVITRDHLPSLFTDAQQLGQVFQNLIGNAVKYHGTDPPRIHVAARRQPGEWIFSVRDNGIGIDPKHAERIFVVFQRLHTRDEYPGTGIGLAICKKIVERHGGQIWVESQPGRGASFLFSMPDSAEAASDPHDPAIEGKP